MCHRFFCNDKCKYFPCHPTDKPEEFNCLFCYCPLYMLGRECGGKFVYLSDGVKDCSVCTLPHVKDAGYEHIKKKIPEAIAKITEKL